MQHFVRAAIRIIINERHTKLPCSKRGFKQLFPELIRIIPREEVRKKRKEKKKNTDNIIKRSVPRRTSSKIQPVAQREPADEFRKFPTRRSPNENSDSTLRIEFSKIISLSSPFRLGEATYKINEDIFRVRGHVSKTCNPSHKFIEMNTLRKGIARLI